jgi:DNA-binding CsgD family transcriptional regulator
MAAVEHGQLFDDLRRAVERSPFAVAVIDLWTCQLVLMNRDAAVLLGVDWTGEPLYVSRFSSKLRQLRSLARLMIDGALDSYETDRLLQRADGTALATRLRLTVVAGERGRRFALVATAGGHGGPATGAQVVRGTAPQPTGPDTREVAAGVVDADWCIDRVSADITALLGGRRADWIGTPILGLVHPEDATELIGAVARAGATGAGRRLRLRLRSNGRGFRQACMVVTPGAASGGFTFAVAEELRGERAAAMQALPEVADLSPRQQEIVRRLLAGERVPQIAGAMFLSGSTVRNHLTVIFRKFRVHSQQELILAIRDRSPSGP